MSRPPEDRGGELRALFFESANELLQSLNEAGLEAAKHSLEKGAVTPSYGPWREDIIKLLNDALATEIVCTLRYKRHHFTAKGLASPKIAEEFLAKQLAAPADLSRQQAALAKQWPYEDLLWALLNTKEFLFNH